MAGSPLSLAKAFRTMKHALRQLAKNPGFTVFALVTLALGIGVTTTAFTTLNRLLLQSLPYRETDRLVQLWASSPRDSEMDQSPGDFVDERDHNTVFEVMAAYYPGWTASLAEPGQAPIRCLSTRVTASFFPMMGSQPQMGRLFTQEEEKHDDPVVLVSNSFWHEHYGADPKILGRVARIDARDYTIVGVMPPSLDNPSLFGGRPGFWPVEHIDVNRDLRNLGWFDILPV